MVQSHHHGRHHEESGECGRRARRGFSFSPSWSLSPPWAPPEEGAAPPPPPGAGRPGPSAVGGRRLSVAGQRRHVASALPPAAASRRLPALAPAPQRCFPERLLPCSRSPPRAAARCGAGGGWSLSLGRC